MRTIHWFGREYVYVDGNPPTIACPRCDRIWLWSPRMPRGHPANVRRARVLMALRRHACRARRRP